MKVYVKPSVEIIELALKENIAKITFSVGEALGSDKGHAQASKGFGDVMTDEGVDKLDLFGAFSDDISA